MADSLSVGFDINYVTFFVSVRIGFVLGVDLGFASFFSFSWHDNLLSFSNYTMNLRGCQLMVG